MRIPLENHKFYTKTINKLTKKGQFEWKDLMAEIIGTGYEPKNWMWVRGSLQEAINAGKIQRDVDLCVERYVAL